MVVLGGSGNLRRPSRRPVSWHVCAGSIVTSDAEFDRGPNDRCGGCHMRDGSEWSAFAVSSSGPMLAESAVCIE